MNKPEEEEDEEVRCRRCGKVLRFFFVIALCDLCLERERDEDQS